MEMLEERERGKGEARLERWRGRSSKSVNSCRRPVEAKASSRLPDTFHLFPSSLFYLLRFPLHCLLFSFVFLFASSSSVSSVLRSFLSTISPPSVSPLFFSSVLLFFSV